MPTDNSTLPYGQKVVITLQCTTCACSITGMADACVAFAQAHVDDTDHEMAYRGVVQTWFRASRLATEEL